MNVIGLCSVGRSHFDLSVCSVVLQGCRLSRVFVNGLVVVSRVRESNETPGVMFLFQIRLICSPH